MVVAAVGQGSAENVADWDSPLLGGTVGTASAASVVT